MTTRSLLSALPASLSPLRITGNGRATREPIHTLCADSRLAGACSLFIAIRGARSDGHDYLPAAYAQGCRCFLVEKPPEHPLPSDADVYLVPDTRRAQAHLAAAYYAYPQKKLRLIGITGTKGKTTTALLCYQLLRDMGESVAYIGTDGVRYGNIAEPTRNTTPDSLELHRLFRSMVDNGVRTVIMEISSQSVRQHRIEGLSFTVGAFTNLSPDHISPTEHPDFEDYRDCKRAFLHDHITKGGTLLLNADDLHAAYMAKGSLAHIRTYGIHTSADLRAERLTPTRCNGIPATLFFCDRQEVLLSMPGEYNVSNALCAIEILRTLGYSHLDILPRLSAVAVPGRLEPLPAPEGCAVLVDYAHNGVSLRAVLTTLRDYTDGRLICLVGSVGGRTQLRRADLGDAAAALADLTVLTADNPDFEDPADICREMAHVFTERGQDNYLILPDRADAIRRALTLMRRGDILLLAGKGTENYQLIRGEKRPFSEREIVAEALSDALLV